MTSIALTLSATPTAPSGTIQGEGAQSPSTPPWVFYLIPLWFTVFGLGYYLVARRLFTRYMDHLWRKRLVLEMRQQRPDWERYP